MKDPRKVLLIGTIGLLAFMFIFTFIRTSLKKPLPVETITEEVAQEEVASPYADWTLFQNGYSFPLPPDWKNTSDTGGTAVLEPGRKIGGIYEISVTVLSDANAPQGQQFTTQKELDDWSVVTTEVQGNIQMLGTIVIDGQNGVLLFDISGAENEWKAIAWTRKDETNLYINFNGNEELTTEDAAAIDYIISNFAFN